MANALQAFNDSQLGIVVGNVLHTLGAIGLLGGLIGYIAWHRHLRQGHEHIGVLTASSFLTYLSIVLNLVGGFMRTWESDHPSLTQFADSPWVRAITIKHAFIFLAMGAAVYLFEVVAPRHRKAMRVGTLPEQPMGGHAVGVTLVLLGILVASVLGAVAGVTPLASAEEPMDGEDPEHDGHDAMPAARYHNATGQLQSTLVAPGEVRSGFEVVDGAADLAITLQWSPAQSNLAIELLGPGGDPVFQPTGSGGSIEGSLGGPPTPGAWTYRITSPDPVANVQYELVVRMPQSAGNESFLANRVTIAPGQFYEINTVSPLNGTLHWDWSATATIHFDVHSHFDDQVQYPVTMETGAHRGSYTNDREGGYSYLWENTGTLPVTLDYRVWGEWELDSIFPA